VLFAISIPILLLGAVVFFIPPKYTLLEMLALYLLFGFALFIGLMGIIVSILGCNKCVARAFGDAFQPVNPARTGHELPSNGRVLWAARR